MVQEQKRHSHSANANKQNKSSPKQKLQVCGVWLFPHLLRSCVLKIYSCPRLGGLSLWFVFVFLIVFDIFGRILFNRTRIRTLGRAITCFVRVRILYSEALRTKILVVTQVLLRMMM